MSAAREQRDVRRLGTAALFAAVATATLSLPRQVLPWPWLLALVLPAALLGLRPHPARRPFVRALLATALQLCACIAAYQLAGPITRPAALAGTILPPMVFVTIRRQDVDATLGLFLSLCVLLVGTILGEPDHPVLVAYVITAVVQLRCESRLHALRLGAPAVTTLRRAGNAALPVVSGVWLGLLCALGAFAVDRSLGVLPTLGGDGPAQPATPSSGPRSVGLPDSFVLGGEGELLELDGERLVSVQWLEGDRAPREDLYLRTGFFEVPGLDSWELGPLDLERYDTRSRDLVLRRRVQGIPVQRLEIQRDAAARDRVFTPPDLLSVFGAADLRVDRQRRWFRQPAQPGGDVYEVTYQELPPPPHDLPVDRRWQRLGLAALPASVDPRHFEPLLAEWRPAGTPLQQAARIAAGLQQRCGYLRREPDGPYDHQLLNFLYGERTGYCMHFASATAIMLRMLSVPCRIGVGLFGGQPGLRADTRVYGSQHAHAWVEIPLQGRGWVVFDPTPPAERGRRTDPEAAAAADEAEDEEAAAPWWSTALATAREVLASPWPWLLLLALFVTPLRRTRMRPQAPGVTRAARPARRLLLHILRELARAGQPRPQGTTLEEHARTLRRLGALPAEIEQAFATYQEVRFGGRTWDEARQRAMLRGLEVARQLPGPGRG